MSNQYSSYKNQVLVTSCDNFIKYVPAVLKSIIAFNRQPIDFYVLTSYDINQSNDLSLFREFEQYPNCSISFSHISQQTRLSYEKVDYSNDTRGNAMSLRLYATMLNLTGRLLYIDLDIICTGNIAPLFDPVTTPMHNCTIAAVPDSFLNYKNILSSGKTFKDKLPAKIQALDLDGIKQAYFNSGVMLIDMDKLNQSNIWLAHIAELQNYTVFPDQDLLNIIHYQDNVQLPSKYNYLTFHLLNNRRFYIANKWQQAYDKQLTQTHISPDSFACVQPVFLHFAGKQKQWNSSATEFIRLYEVCSKPINQLIAKPVRYYQYYLDQLYITYTYQHLLKDYLDPSFAQLNLTQLKQWRKGEAWSFNPLLLNTKIFNYGGIKNLVHNALTTKYREKLNQEFSKIQHKTM